MNRLFCFALLLAYTIHAGAQPADTYFKQTVDSFYAANPKAVGIIVDIEAPGRHLSWKYATGYSNAKTKQKLSPNRPVLIASNTKTYVAAAIMLLVEKKKIKLDEPIAKLIKPATASLMENAGYHLQDITIKQLLSHTSGITDYANEAYFDTVDKHKRHKWTRDEQIQLAVHTGGPYAAPGDSFRYADMNYLLLTEVLERQTKLPYYIAIRSMLNYAGNGIRETWFANLEPAPKHTMPLAHQYWEKLHWDSYDLDPSWDLYGGGGIIATTQDMALFYKQLFGGHIITDTAVLNAMHQDVPSKSKVNYCLGIRKLSFNGHIAYYHGGFWGTDVIYFPDLNTTIAITILERAQRDISADIAKKIIKGLE